MNQGKLVYLIAGY